ncbi:hypothetical protein M0R72_12055 [Candidatus Pacearchaeota archaeon]|jgi:hypothetical protein|nr:hypothetical protein [Candidatus Pacearchaeota archaeon]
MKPQKIFVSLDHNEIMRPRAKKVEKAVLEDDRFEMRDPASLPFDLQFVAERECPQCHGVPYPDDDFEDQVCPVICGICKGKCVIKKTFHVELKDFSEDAGSDYLSSILNGHLWEQVLVARERQEPLAIVVLGDDNDVGDAIRKAAGRGNRGHKVDPEKLMEYFRMVEGFEANCIALNIPVWWLKTDPHKRMLLRVRKILEGGDLSGFAPAPDEGERQAVGLSILAGKGIGPTKAMAILEKFRIRLEPKGDAYLNDCEASETNWLD